MRIILVRHYRTQANSDHCIIGWDDSPPLPDWQDDIDYVYARMRDAGIEPQAVYASDLGRSRRTAEALAASFGIAEIAISPALKEINYGEMQGKQKPWVAEQLPLHKKDPDMVYPGGESFNQMQRRSVEFLSSLVSALDSRTVLVVSHAGVIRGIICHFLGLDFGRFLKQAMPFHYIGDFQFDGPRLRRYDELGKLSGFVRDGIIEVPLAGLDRPAEILPGAGKISG